jgi:geranylgeranyl diphosphate synthase type 3
MPSNFQSPNAIPPRTSSYGIPNLKHQSSALRPLSEVDWLSSSKKSKLYHSPSAPLRQSLPGAMEPQTNSNPSSPPPPDSHKALGDDFIYGNKDRWNEEKERILLGPYDYLLGHPGKDIRSQCIAAFNQWLRVPAERLEVITRVVGMLHTASLL